MEMIHDAIREEIIETARRIATTKSAGKITVRDIMKELHITNRVFYNRFHNMGEVLEILYAETITKVRESLALSWDGTTDFGEHIQIVAARTISLTYESRRNISAYIFEADSLEEANCAWWCREITELIRMGKKAGYIRTELDETAVSYSMWCFIRGYSADALARKLPEEEALKQFRVGLDVFLRGMKA